MSIFSHYIDYHITHFFPLNFSGDSIWRFKFQENPVKVSFIFFGPLRQKLRHSDNHAQTCFIKDQLWMVETQAGVSWRWQRSVELASLKSGRLTRCGRLRRLRQTGSDPETQGHTVKHGFKQDQENTKLDMCCYQVGKTLAGTGA